MKLLRNLDIKNNTVHKKKIIIKNNNNLLKKTPKRNEKMTVSQSKLLGARFFWNYEYEDILKCYADQTNQVNIYYISSFEPSNKDKFNQTLEKCYKLIDDNIYPIIVINDLNNGGFVSFSQLFLGIISPLIPIRLYSGRIRISETFDKTEKINQYINSNLTIIENCTNGTYEILSKEV